MKKFLAFLCLAVMLCSITSVSLAANKAKPATNSVRTVQRVAGHWETVRKWIPGHYESHNTSSGHTISITSLSGGYGHSWTTWVPGRYVTERVWVVSPVTISK